MMTQLSKIEGMVAQLSDLGSPIDDNQGCIIDVDESPFLI